MPYAGSHARIVADPGVLRIPGLSEFKQSLAPSDFAVDGIGPEAAATIPASSAKTSRSVK
jgi:hypothetical protein